MENASQALVIAGGILLGILTLTMLVYMFNNMAIIGNADKQKEEMERLADWNAEWEAYNKQYLYGAEVLTVLNKAEQNNLEYDNNVRYTVQINVKNGESATVPNAHDFLETRKTNIFICTEVKYNNETGRVNEMTFQFEE